MVVEIFEVVLGGFRSFPVLVLTSNLTFSKSGGVHHGIGDCPFNKIFTFNNALVLS